MLFWRVAEMWYYWALGREKKNRNYFILTTMLFNNHRVLLQQIQIVLKKKYIQVYTFEDEG